MKISLDALQLLDAIEEHGSFAAAAQALYRVPSALTHAVKRIEDDLGVTLFVREGRRAVLTPAGRMLLEEGRHLLRAANDLECRVKRVATGWESELRIAVDALIDPVALLPLVARFDQQRSGTRLRLSLEVLGGCWDALYTARADLAVGASGDPPPGGGFAVQPLGSVEFVFVCAPDHALALAREPIAPSLIQQHRAVALADTSRQLIARSAGLLSGQEILVVPDVVTKIAAHVAGLGVGYLPRHVARREVEAGRLVIRRVAESRPEVPLLAAWRSGPVGNAIRWWQGVLAEPEVASGLLDSAPATAHAGAGRPSRASVRSQRSKRSEQDGRSG